jgi:hypothetical protein
MRTTLAHRTPLQLPPPYTTPGTPNPKKFANILGPSTVKKLSG